MVKGCGPKCAKYFLFALNALFFLAGGVILGVGIWARVDKRFSAIATAKASPEDLASLEKLIHVAAAIFIAFGAFVFVGGFLGCCGAIRESKCLLGFYIAFIVLVMIGELAAGIFAVVVLKDFTGALSAAVVEDLVRKYPNSSYVTDERMSTMLCCGWNGYADFRYSAFSNTTSMVVPSVCCRNPGNVTMTAICRVEARNSTTPDQLITVGCKARMDEQIRPFQVIFIGVAAGIVALELIVLIAAILLCATIEGRN